MNHLLHLRDDDFGAPAALPEEEAGFKRRNAARAIVFNPDGLIGLLYTSVQKYHKLPGGGIDEGESWQEALVREAREEMGVEVVLRDAEVGIVTESKKCFGVWQTSYCGIADVVGGTGIAALEEEELALGLVPVWVPPREIMALFAADTPTTLDGRFISTRDAALVKAALELCNG